MTTLREAAQQALEAICGAKLCEFNSMSSRHEMVRLMDEAIATLRTALAEPVQEPVAWWHRKSDTFTSGSLVANFKEWTPLYPAPPQRKPLSEEEITNIGKAARAVEGPHILPVTFARAVERAHGIGEKE